MALIGIASIAMASTAASQTQAFATLEATYTATIPAKGTTINHWTGAAPVTLRATGKVEGSPRRNAMAVIPANSPTYNVSASIKDPPEAQIGASFARNSATEFTGNYYSSCLISAQFSGPADASTSKDSNILERFVFSGPKGTAVGLDVTGSYQIILSGNGGATPLYSASANVRISAFGGIARRSRSIANPVMQNANQKRVPFHFVFNGRIPAGGGLEVRVVVDPTTEVASGECMLLLGLSPMSMPLPFGGQDTLLVDPIGAYLVTISGVPVFPVPSVPGLAGAHIYFQVYMNNPVAFPLDPVQMSNGLDVTLGIGTQSYGAGSGIRLWALEPPALGGVVRMNFGFN